MSSWKDEMEYALSQSGGSTEELAERITATAYITSREGQVSHQQESDDAKYLQKVASKVRSGVLTQLDATTGAGRKQMLAMLALMPNVRFRHALLAYLDLLYAKDLGSWADKIAAGINARRQQEPGRNAGPVYSNFMTRRLTLDSEPFAWEERAEIMRVIPANIPEFLWVAFLTEPKDPPVKSKSVERKENIMAMKRDGKSKKKIADAIGVSTGTVNSEIRDVFLGNSGLTEYDELPMDEIVRLAGVSGTLTAVDPVFRRLPSERASSADKGSTDKGSAGKHTVKVTVLRGEDYVEETVSCASADEAERLAGMQRDIDRFSHVNDTADPLDMAVVGPGVIDDMAPDAGPEAVYQDIDELIEVISETLFAAREDSDDPCRVSVGIEYIVRDKTDPARKSAKSLSHTLYVGDMLRLGHYEAIVGTIGPQSTDNEVIDVVRQLAKRINVGESDPLWRAVLGIDVVLFYSPLSERRQA